MKQLVIRNLALIISGLILIGLTLSSLVLFFSKFNGGLSGNQQDWGAFGSYLSGTVGVVAACLAVIWLMISVHLQKKELNHLKNELASSAEEQKKQTYISALSALISSSRQAIAEHQNDLIALNDGDEHLHPFFDKTHLLMSIDNEWARINFYQKQIEQYLKEQYVKTESNFVDSSAPWDEILEE
ncbi:hypothetical protein [Photobacterium leiognathi]|uniref:hypothetical protein n=1 Tax=Photobacterium leiognathi TaxID=553611 RepID=UPI0029828453|nr:hypothetical protein [Photobacterium leiognathi]